MASNLNVSKNFIKLHCVQIAKCFFSGSCNIMCTFT